MRSDLVLTTLKVFDPRFGPFFLLFAACFYILPMQREAPNEENLQVQTDCNDEMPLQIACSVKVFGEAIQHFDRILILHGYELLLHKVNEKDSKKPSCQTCPEWIGFQGCCNPFYQDIGRSNGAFPRSSVENELRSLARRLISRTEARPRQHQ